MGPRRPECCRIWPVDLCLLLPSFLTWPGILTGVPLDSLLTARWLLTAEFPTNRRNGASEYVLSMHEAQGVNCAEREAQQEEPVPRGVILTAITAAARICNHV